MDKVKAILAALVDQPKAQALSFARSVLGYALGLLALAAAVTQAGYTLPDVAVQVVAWATLAAAGARHVIAFLDPTNDDFGYKGKAS